MPYLLVEKEIGGLVKMLDRPDWMTRLATTFTLWGRIMSYASFQVWTLPYDPSCHKPEPAELQASIGSFNFH